MRLYFKATDALNMLETDKEAFVTTSYSNE